MKNTDAAKKRNPVILAFSLRFAKEYYAALCEMQKEYTQDEIQESNDLIVRQRAYWTSLIIEIGKLFDTFDSSYKQVLSLKKTQFFRDLPWKDTVDTIHGEAIIQKILNTRKTFTAHFGELDESVVSVPEICSSKLGELLNKLDKPLAEFETWLRNNRSTA